MELLLIIVAFAVVLAVCYAAFNYFGVKKMEEGTERMQEIAGAIRIGANAFIRYEYKVVAIIGSIVAVLLGVIISWQTGVAFVIGATLSASAGWVGMKIATYSNVRVANILFLFSCTIKNTTITIVLRGTPIITLITSITYATQKRHFNLST